MGAVGGSGSHLSGLAATLSPVRNGGEVLAHGHDFRWADGKAQSED